MSRFWCFIFFFFFVASAQAAIVDLQTFVSKSVENSLQVQSQKLSLENARDEATNASRFFLPRLDLSSTLGKREYDPPYPYQPNTSAVSLGVSSLLWDSGNSIYLWTQSEQKIKRAELEFDKSRDAVTLEASNRFLSLSRLMISDEVERESYRTLEKQAEIVSGQYRQGLRSRTDYLRFQSQLRRGLLRLSQSESEITKSKASLKELWPDLDLAELLPTKPQWHAKPVPIKIVTAEDHRDLKIVQLKKEIRAYDEKIQRQRMGPDVGLKANAVYNGNDFTTPRSRDTYSESRGWNILLTFNWNLLDWGERSRKNDILARQLMVQENEDRLQLRKLQADLTSLAARVRHVQKSVEISSELLKMEESNYNVVATAYREGKSSYLDLITSLTDLTSARRQQSEDQFDWMNLRNEGLYHEGRLYETLAH